MSSLLHRAAPSFLLCAALTACSSGGAPEAGASTGAPTEGTADSASGAESGSGDEGSADGQPDSATAGADDTGTAPTEDTTAPPVAVEHVAGRVDHLVENINGQMVSLHDYRGDVLLIVNTASRCGFTPQYEGLQQLHETYGASGLRILGFPANDFAGQEPGTNEEIADFCSREFGVGFQMFAKVEVTGIKTHELFRTLTEESPEQFRGPIAWNFTKFLVDTNGFVIARFAPATEPEDPAVIAAIEAALAAR